MTGFTFDHIESYPPHTLEVCTQNSCNCLRRQLKMFRLRTMNYSLSVSTEVFNLSFQSTSDLVTPVMVSARLLERFIPSSGITPTLNMFNGKEPDQPPLRKKKRVSLRIVSTILQTYKRTPYIFALVLKVKIVCTVF